MNRRQALALSMMAAAIALASAQESPRPGAWTLSTAATASVPLLSGDFSGSASFGPAWGGGISASHPLGTSPLSLRLDAAGSSAGLAALDGFTAADRLNEAQVLAGIGLERRLNPKLSLDAFVEGGLAYGAFSTDSGAGSAYAAARAGLGLGFAIGKDLELAAGATASYMAGLYAAAGGYLGLGYRLPERAAAARAPAKLRLLEIKNLSIGELFPIFRSYYDQNPVGAVKIVNAGSKPAKGVKVSFVIKQYMDAAKECATIDLIAPGQSVEVPLFGLFNDRILDVTEATKAIAEVAVSYDAEGVEGECGRSATVVVYDRNAMTWDDDRHAAAFVSSKDPWVLDLTGNILAAVKASRNPEVEKNLQTAIAFHEGLRAYGISYVLSPNRPFANEGADLAAVDTLKFPRQTLGFRAGDCADLSVLYASCFEAAGIDTAFVTVPGHIFMAIDLGLSPDEARERRLDLDELIVRDGRAWLPIETTMRDSGLVEAWRKAAAEWRTASMQRKAGFYPLHDCWKTFAPVGLPADGSSPTPPAAEKTAAAFRKELATVVDAELRARSKAVDAAMAQGAAAAKSLNERGILYAKYGRYDDAMRDFQAAAKAGSASALVNQGNLSLLRADPAAALRLYRSAEQQLAGSVSLQLNIAKAAAALGKAAESDAALAKAKAIDPQAAERSVAAIQAAAAGSRAAEVGDDSPLWF